MYYVTKYALTQGILAVKDDDAELSDADYLYLTPKDGGLKVQVAKKDWFRDRAEAIARVQDLVDAKMRSLDRSLAALKKLDVTRTQDW